MQGTAVGFSFRGLRCVWFWLPVPRINRLPHMLKSSLPVPLSLGTALIPAHRACGAPQPACEADRFVDIVGVNVPLHDTDTGYWDFAKLRGASKKLGVRHVRDGLVLDGNPPCSTLRKAFATDFLIGAARNTAQIDGRDAKGGELAARQFSALTAENDMKWQSVHPTPDRFNFKPAFTAVMRKSIK